LSAPYIPPIDPSNASDTQNFDDTFLDMEPVIDDPNENDQTDTDQEREQTDTDRTDGEESNTTPSQSRSPSVIPPADDSVDVFDGYSFKGRHSILIDSDEDEESGDEDEEDEDEVSVAETKALKVDAQADVNGGLSPEEHTPEPKTPEAHQPSLPEATVEVTPMESPVVDGILGTQHADKDKEEVEQGPPREDKAAPAPVDSKRSKAKTTKAPVVRPAPKASRVRREKSGVPALDRNLSDTIDESGEMTEKEEDDDDWDFVEAADGEDRNGVQGTSLFARGVVDRYRLAVFRKASTPAHPTSRSFSTTSKVSDLDGSELADSPTPSDKQRRGRTPGLTFRKHPRQFLQPKSPHSKKSTSATKTLGHSTSASLSVSTTSSPSMLTPSPSMNSTLPVTPSLKSKESHASSVGTQSGSSDQSPNADEGLAASDTIRAAPSTEEPEKLKSKKLKKYKEGAEKVLSLFASPRQQS
jgi:serum/glucocorticoid-regulated kinase 2